MSVPLRVTAQVSVVLKIEAESAWGLECTMQQVHDQGKADALNRLRRIVGDQRGFAVVGEPKVSMVVVHPEKP